MQREEKLEPVRMILSLGLPAASRQSRNEAGKTDRKIGGQKNGIPVYLSVSHVSVSRSHAGSSNLCASMPPFQGIRGAVRFDNQEFC
jgi:hypothetical protein